MNSVEKVFNLLLRLFSVGVLICFFFFLLRYDSLELRTIDWGNSADCIIDLVKTSSPEDQTVLLGTSRTMQGVSVDTLAHMLGKPPGTVINLAQNGRAVDLQYLLLDELQSRRRLERVIVELSVGNHTSDQLVQQRLKAGLNFGSGASYIRSDIAATFASKRQIDDG